MNYTRFLLSSLFLVALLASSASAQAVRTFVASTGNDSNPCSRTAACRTFQAAVNAAAAGGEVVALNSAGFGSNVSINKSISIIASPGVYAGITVVSGDGIDINIGASETVVLRGLTVINQGSTGSGIVYGSDTSQISGGTLVIESCFVNGFSALQQAGVFFHGGAHLEMKDSSMRDNRTGLIVKGGSIANISGSIASDNVANGIVGLNFGAEAIALNIESCVVANNGLDGINSTSNANGVTTVRVSNSTVTGNSTGLHNTGSPAVLLSRGNNTVEGNGMDTSGTIGSYTPK